MNMISKILLGVIVLSIATSCASTKNDDATGVDGLPAYDTVLNANNDLVASNLIFALTQLDEVRPLQTTIQINEPITELGKTIEGRLRDAGYGIQKVRSDQGPHYVRYKYEDSTTEKGAVTRYTMSIGSLIVERDFSVEGGSILPDSAMVITGAEETDIELNDNIFAGTGTSYEDDVIFEAAAEPVITEVGTDNPRLVNANQGVQSIKKNLYDTRTSNYAGLFADYEDVESEILIFANDSMNLGKKNKDVVKRYVSRMNPDTDVISVIGCSHGKSSIANGNSVLAIGRANRVKEAFVIAGVEYGKVLDEGCWAPRHFDEMMPRRGVVLTLKRLKG